VQQKRKRPRKRRPGRKTSRRTLPQAGSNLLLYFLILAVVTLFVVTLFTEESQVIIPYGQLIDLVQQGTPEKHPAAAITVTEGAAGKEKSVRYSQLAKLKIAPHEITGTVTREVLDAGGKSQKEEGIAFHTPRLGLENDNLALELRQHGFTNYQAEQAPSTWRSFLSFVATVGGLVLIVVLVLYLTMRHMGGPGSAMAFGRSRGKLYAQEEMGVNFHDVAGIDEAVDEVREVVDFLKQPEKYQVLGGRIPKGVLLVGPPGTGKTLLAKAIAGEAGVPFFSLSGSDFVEMFVGVGAARVRDMFLQAQAKAPCIVFIDELDALGKTRGSSVVGGHDEREQTLNALLVEMDGFSSNSGVIVLAATNRPETLDPALLRPGRFDRHVLVDRPDVRGREKILEVHVKRVRLDESVDLKDIARITSGFVGADLANLVNEAALLAARAGKPAVFMQEFNEGVERVVAGLEKRQRIIHAEEKQRVAYHESGHALVAASLPNTDPVHKVSIIPRGLAALGYTMQRPEDDRYLMTQPELESRIQVLLAGTLTEELIFGDVSTGARNDLERATEIARSMVMDFGMSRLGRVTYRESRAASMLGGPDFPGQRTHSERTAREIDEEIRFLLAQAQEKVQQILRARRPSLVALAELLIEKETIDNGELKAVLESSSPSPMIVPGTADAAPPRRPEEAAAPPRDRAESG
jgi:cell division protease FtsH